jgi:Carboxypeptidase regulatory-like domain
MRRIGLSLICVLWTLAASAQGVPSGPSGLPSGLPPGPPPPAGPVGAPRAGRPDMPPRDQAAPQTGTSRLRGRVVAADTGQPLRRVMVRLTGADIREGRSTTTNIEGLFEFRELAAGRYTITASKGGYVALAYGQKRPFEPGRPVALADNQTIDKLDISLPRGSVITGRIVDEVGEPVADVAVMAMRQQFFQGRRRLMPMGRASMTDDIGQFRLFGLSPGQYYLSVSARGGPTPMFDQSDERTGYAPTYYPGTSDVSAAQRLTLALGQTLSDIQIPLVLTQTARVSGTVVDLDGRRATTGMVVATVKGVFAPMAMGPTVGPIRPDGSFSISGVAPGEYTLRATMPNGNSGPGRVATATVSVSGHDVPGIQLVPTRPVKVSGRVLVDGMDPTTRQGLRPDTIQIIMTPTVIEDALGFGVPGGPARVKEDFSFETVTAPGRMLARVIIPNATFGLKSVRVRGADVTDTGFDVTANEDITELEIDVTSQLPELSGLVTNAKGERLSDYTVLAFAQDRERLEANSARYVVTGRPDQEGRFRIRTLPPGAYHLIAVEYVDPAQASDPEYLESLRPAATSVSLGQGETKTLDLRLADAR